MITVILHGYLKKLWPEPITFDARTAAEAIYAFDRQTKAFKPRVGQRRHLISAKGFETVEDLKRPTDIEELHLYPAFATGKGGAFTQILIGSVLVAAGIAVAPYAPWASTFLISTGAGLVLGGVMQLLMPAPEEATSGSEGSNYLGSPKNTTAIGTPIPILYGRRKVYGHILGFDLDAVDVK